MLHADPSAFLDVYLAAAGPPVLQLLLAAHLAVAVAVAAQWRVESAASFQALEVATVSQRIVRTENDGKQFQLPQVFARNLCVIFIFSIFE